MECDGEQPFVVGEMYVVSGKRFRISHLSLRDGPLMRKEGWKTVAHRVRRIYGYRLISIFSGHLRVFSACTTPSNRSFTVPSWMTTMVGVAFRLEFLYVLGVLDRIDLFNGDAEGFSYFGIDRGLFHTPHTSRLVKTEYTQCHEDELAGAIKRVWIDQWLLIDVTVISAPGYPKSTETPSGDTWVTCPMRT